IEAEVLDGGPAVRLAMVDATILQCDLTLDTGDGVTSFDLANTGVPHIVGVVPDVDAFPDFDTRGRALRHHESLMPEGANVNLIHQVASSTIRMRTWERGVEAETLACGTGAVACAVIAAHRGLVTQPVRVLTSSGHPLTVTWTADDDTMRGVRLTGEARYVARGVLDPEGFS